MVGYTDEARAAATIARVLANKERKKLKEQLYSENPIKCKFCEKSLSYEQANSKLSYCSIACSNKMRVRSPESKAKVAKTIANLGKDKRKKIIITCKICGSIFTPIVKKSKIGKCCGSTECSKKIRSEASKRTVQKCMENGTFVGWKARTKEPSYAEQYFIDLFENEQIEGFERELRVGRWFIDFAFIEKQIAIEIDGKQHKKRKHLDAEKDKYLEENGWKVFRIEWYNPISENKKNLLYPQIEQMKQILGV